MVWYTLILCYFMSGIAIHQQYLCVDCPLIMCPSNNMDILLAILWHMLTYFHGGVWHI